MKTLRIISIVMLVVGGAMFATGILFKILHWLFASQLLMGGPVIMVVGGLLFLISHSKSNQSG